MLPSCYTCFHNQCPRTCPSCASRTMTGEDNRDALKAIRHFHTKFAGLSSLESCRLILTCLWLGTPNQGSMFWGSLQNYEAVTNESHHLHNFCQRPCRQESLTDLEPVPQVTLKLCRSGLDLEDNSPQTVDQLWIIAHCCWPPPQRRVILSPPWLKSSMAKELPPFQWQITINTPHSASLSHNWIP